jgi:hypothetical protein
MIFTVDPFGQAIPPAGRRIIGDGWQGVFRHVILEVLPVPGLAKHFSDSLGAPAKELYSMAGVVFLADFFGWTAREAIEAYLFRSDVQYALNLEPGVTLSTRTFERYQKLFRENDLAATVFEDVTTRLIKRLDLDVSRQRLDPRLQPHGLVRSDEAHRCGNQAVFDPTQAASTYCVQHAPRRFSRSICSRRVATLRRCQGRRGPKSLPATGRRGSLLPHLSLRWLCRHSI